MLTDVDVASLRPYGPGDERRGAFARSGRPWWDAEDANAVVSLVRDKSLALRRSRVLEEG